MSASECFTMTAFPAFLRHSHYPHTSTHPPPSQPQGTHTITHNTPIDPAPTSNAFTVDPSLKHTYVTPGLFAQPTLGKAIASSTPSSLRTISFPHEPIPFRLGQDTMSVDRHLKDHASSGVGVLTDPKMVAGGKRTFSGDGGLSVVRGVLDFGSASVESGRVMSKTAALMPLTPRWVGHNYDDKQLYLYMYTMGISLCYELSLRYISYIPSPVTGVLMCCQVLVYLCSRVPDFFSPLQFWRSQPDHTHSGHAHRGGSPLPEL